MTPETALEEISRGLQMALTLGRPEGNAPGGSGLALFYVEVRNADGTMNGRHPP